jgi:hypothetical protein
MTVAMSEHQSPQAIHRVVGQIVLTFPLLECAQCAVAVMLWLDQQGISYQLLRLRPKRRGDLFIISDRVASGESITENGVHYGVEVLGKVFDNLSATGLTRSDWLQDFRCRSGGFIIEERDRL